MYKRQVYDDACAYAQELAEKEGYTFVHPFDDLDVATGQGTIAMEIVQELPTVISPFSNLSACFIHARSISSTDEPGADMEESRQR